MSKKKKKGPGTAPPYGKKDDRYRGDDIPANVPTVGGLKWMSKKLKSEREGYNV